MPAATLLQNWDGLLWLLLFLGPLLFFQRQLHFELQALFLLITRHENAALGIFSLLFLPGVLLHETSHYLIARLLGVRTGRFSLMPQVLPDGRLQLGFVETAPADLLRDGLIGAAPLVTGGVVMAYLGAYRLGLLPLAALFTAANWPGLWSALAALPEQPDFWLWFYLAFAVSTTMLPSDIRPAGLAAGVAGGADPAASWWWWPAADPGCWITWPPG